VVTALDQRLGRLPGLQDMGLVRREVGRWRQLPTAA
jgi:hypothetical protein